MLNHERADLYKSRGMSNDAYALAIKRRALESNVANELIDLERNALMFLEEFEYARELGGRRVGGAENRNFRNEVADAGRRAIEAVRGGLKNLDSRLSGVSA